MQKKGVALFSRSLLSGVLIGIGVVINLISDNKYIGAMLFSFALLTIIQNKLPLYTGRIGFLRESKIKDLLQILVFNLIGAPLPALMAASCREGLYDKVVSVSQTKFSYSFWQLFLLGALCGALMLVAVYTKKEVVTVFCIMIFILSGFEHCIADFPFLAFNPSAANFVKFICIVLGNSVGAVAAYELMGTEQKGQQSEQKGRQSEQKG